MGKGACPLLLPPPSPAISAKTMLNVMRMPNTMSIFCVAVRLLLRLFLAIKNLLSFEVALLLMYVTWFFHLGCGATPQPNSISQNLGPSLFADNVYAN
jgi:hypothetical protein